MGYVPLLVDVKNLRVLFIGGGRQARNKLANFVDQGAFIRIVSPSLNEDIKPYVDASRVQWICREYRPSDLRHMQLVMACTNDPKMNRRIIQDAAEEGILAGNISLEGPRNIQMMAYRRWESLIVSVSTQGQAPMISPWILQEIQSSLDSRWPRVISAMHRFRQYVAVNFDSAEAQEIWKRLKTFPFHTWLTTVDDQNWNDVEWEKNLKLAFETWLE